MVGRRLLGARFEGKALAVTRFSLTDPADRRHQVVVVLFNVHERLQDLRVYRPPLEPQVLRGVDGVGLRAARRPVVAVARNAVKVGTESYGLKHLEQLTSFERGHDIDAEADT